MTKETVFKLLKKMFNSGNTDDVLIIQPKHGPYLFVKIGWLKEEFDVEASAYMPDYFMVSTSNEDPVYFMDYDEISWIRW